MVGVLEQVLVVGVAAVARAQADVPMGELVPLEIGAALVDHLELSHRCGLLHRSRSPVRRVRAPPLFWKEKCGVSCGYQWCGG